MINIKESILTQQDIINTYNKKQRRQCDIYFRYLKLKKQNPEWGHKRLASNLKVSYGRITWWYFKNSPPYPIQTINWLKEKGLIPLNLENSKSPLIAKILGAIFGDGGIFQNLNAIFLSSSELEAVKEFGEDIKTIFGNEIEFNSRIIEGGEYGHSWCYQNTNRNIIRFFQSLGAPIGRKTKIKLKIPPWTQLKECIEDEFFSAYFGSEINIPKIHISKTHLDTLSIGLTGPIFLERNRINFLEDIKKYLTNKGVITGSIVKSRNKERDDSYIFKLLISTRLDNIILFKEKIKIHYCNYKKEKLSNTLREFIKLKKQRYNNLLYKGYSSSSAMNLLNLTKSSFKQINQK